MFSHEFYSACLRALLALFHRVIDAPTRLQSGKIPIEHAMHVEIDFASLAAIEKTMVREEPGHGSDGLRFMQLRLATQASHLILQLTPGPAEGVGEGEIEL